LAAQKLDVVRGDGGRRKGQLFGVRQQRPRGGVDGRRAPVGLDGLRQFVVDLGPEVVPVGLNSIMAVVGFGDDDGEHFALRAGEG
jgi:hypothetical protein